MRRRRPGPDRPHKYGAVRTGGYASQGEAARAHELRLLAAAGEISDLREQVPVVVSPDGCQRITLRADFVYLEDGREVIEDFKGFETEAFKLKWKLLRWRRPDAILRISRAGRGGRFDVVDS